MNFYSHYSLFSFADLNSILTSFTSLCKFKQQWHILSHSHSFISIKYGSIFSLGNILSVNLCFTRPWPKRINVKDFPFLPVITHYEYQFCFHETHFTYSYMFQYGEYQLPLMKSVFTWTHILQQTDIFLCNGKDSTIYWFYNRKIIGVE